MTEKELIEFGFKKEIITDSESQNGYDYYYYTLEVIQDIVLVSSESDEIEDDEWGVFFSDSNCEIWDSKLLKELIDVFNKIKA